MYTKRGVSETETEETGERLAPTRCICIGKQTAAGSRWLARKMNKIMKKKGKFRVETAQRGAMEQRKGERWSLCQSSDSRGMKRSGRTSIRGALLYDFRAKGANRRRENFAASFSTILFFSLQRDPSDGISIRGDVVICQRELDRARKTLSIKSNRIDSRFNCR